ncbi:hypothetical protein SAMN05216452_2928 [Nitratireductor aquibiodomus]|uniref:Uncharacterized protein n=1 Tax=Nitratireductor aquibiodomus TaxID=204799 RepID=A0A1H4LPD0_9HYPH|nr:hypothetical protein SAMN05216452_2928 [Nitratireductor aquibiodomus]
MFGAEVREHFGNAIFVRGDIFWRGASDTG